MAFTINIGQPESIKWSILDRYYPLNCLAQNWAVEEGFFALSGLQLS